MLLNKEQRAKRGDEQGRSWEGRELTLGTWGGRRGGVPDFQSRTSRAAAARRGRAGDELGGAGEEQDRREEEQDQRGAPRG